VDCVFYWNCNGMDHREYSHWHDSGAAVPSVGQVTISPTLAANIFITVNGNVPPPPALSLGTWLRVRPC
jgi:hypothetical protein